MRSRSSSPIPAFALDSRSAGDDHQIDGVRVREWTWQIGYGASACDFARHPDRQGFPT
jgi:hypothetical protein